MAGLTERLKRTRPELSYITTVRLDVVAYQLRRVAFQPAAYLAGELIAAQDRPSKRLPARRFVQLPRFGIGELGTPHVASVG